jgi:nucleoside-diphosphate-sugar epimerase
MKRKVVLVTGCGTGVGWNIAEYFIKADFKVIATYNKTKPVSLYNCKIIKLNLSKSIKKKLKFDYLVHCASKVPKDGQNNTNLITNLKITENIIDLAKKSECKKIVFLSAVSVYGKPKKKLIDELTEIDDRKFYSKSKIISEKKIINLSKKKNITCIILRSPAILGNNIYNNFVANLFLKLLRGEIPIIFNLNQYFNNIIHISTLNKVILKAIMTETNNNLYILGSKNPIKIITILKMISTIIQKKIDYKEGKRVSDNFLINTRKIRKKNYEIITTKQTLRKYLLEFKDLS